MNEVLELFVRANYGEQVANMLFRQHPLRDDDLAYLIPLVTWELYYRCRVIAGQGAITKDGWQL